MPNNVSATDRAVKAERVHKGSKSTKTSPASPAIARGKEGENFGAIVLPVNTRWFREKLADKELSQRKIAISLNLDPAAVSLMLRGKRRMQLDEAAELARLLGVPVDEVLVHAGIEMPSDPKTSVPIVGWVDEHGEVKMEALEGPRRAMIPNGVGAGVVAVRYRTALTPADALDGWILYYKPSDQISPDALGRLCVVKFTPEGPAIVRIVRRGYDFGTYNLVPWVGQGTAMENVKIGSACPVLWAKTG